MDKKYIVLDDEKKALHRFKDGEKALSWDNVKDFDNVALLVPKPFVVLDFDTVSDATIIQRIIDDLDLKCKIMQTTRGVHVWFKSNEPWKISRKHDLRRVCTAIAVHIRVTPTSKSKTAASCESGCATMTMTK